MGVSSFWAAIVIRKNLVFQRSPYNHAIYSAINHSGRLIHVVVVLAPCGPHSPVEARDHSVGTADGLFSSSSPVPRSGALAFASCSSGVKWVTVGGCGSVWRCWRNGPGHSTHCWQVEVSLHNLPFKKTMARVIQHHLWCLVFSIHHGMSESHPNLF